MEKITCNWKKIIMFASIILATLFLAFTFYFKEEIMVNKNNATIDEQAGAIVNTSNGNFTASNIDILKKASELLGVQYDWGGKGLKTLDGKWDPNPWSYKVTQGNIATSTEIQGIKNNTVGYNGIDCSGLVYWALTNVGIDKGYTLPTAATEYKYGTNGFTTGFARNNPVPLDALDWLSYVNSNSTTPHGFSELKGLKRNSDGTYTAVNTTATGDRSVADVNLTYLGNKVNVLKKNDFITSDLRYYEYYDQNGNKKILPSGTIVISYGSGVPSVVNGTTTYPYEDHAWIFIGDLKTSDPNQVAAILKNMGLNIPDNAVANGLIKKTGGANTCWRIEAATGSGVTINNGNPDMGSLVEDKGIGPIWALQVANEIAGNYNLKVQKIDETGKSISLNEQNIFTVKRNNSVMNSYTVFGNVVSYNPVSITTNSCGDDVITIQETSAPAGYIKYNKTIELVIKKALTTVKIDGKDVAKYVGQVKEVKIDGVTQTRTNNAYDNEKVYVDWLNGEIVVKIKNSKVDLALKKTITHVTKVGETDWTKVTEQNGFNVSRFITDDNNISINTNTLKTGSTTNAVYTMNKTPVEVAKGDKVRYSINIYNEGEVAAKARVIKDYIPDGLKVLNVGLDNEELSAITLDEYNN